MPSGTCACGGVGAGGGGGVAHCTALVKVCSLQKKVRLNGFYYYSNTVIIYLIPGFIRVHISLWLAIIKISLILKWKQCCSDLGRWIKQSRERKKGMYINTLVLKERRGTCTITIYHHRIFYLDDHDYLPHHHHNNRANDYLYFSTNYLLGTVVTQVGILVLMVRYTSIHV